MRNKPLCRTSIIPFWNLDARLYKLLENLLYYITFNVFSGNSKFSLLELCYKLHWTTKIILTGFGKLVFIIRLKEQKIAKTVTNV